MTKLKLSIVGAVAIAGMVTSLVIQRRAKVELNEKDEVLRQQDSQLANLAAEHQRLSNLVAQAKNSPADDRMTELQRLRSEVERLRKQKSELAGKLEEIRRSRSPRAPSKQEFRPPEYYVQLHQTAGGKTKDALFLSNALTDYATKHQGQYPVNFDHVTAYLTKTHLSLTGTNEFEIVYQGSLNQIKNIPLAAVAVVRDRQAWLAPSGKWAKVYGLASGTAEVVESDDDFRSWEAEHIFPPPSAGQ